MFGSSDGSSDGLFFRVAIFATVLSITVTALFSIILPGVTAEYSYDDFINERDTVMAFTGDNMTNSNPWRLVQVTTPYVIGTDYNVDDSGFLYGSSVDYNSIGTSVFKMDKNQRSGTTLNQSNETVTVTETELKWQYRNNITKWTAIPGSVILSTLTGKPLEYYTTTTNDVDYPTWQHTGYRYVLKPMLPFKDDTPSSVDGSLSLVWYKSPNGSQGISGGLVIYGKDRTIISNYSATDIISDYNTSSGYATKYNFVFDGIPLNLNIRFDPEVINGGSSLEEAWDDGAWSIAITSVSAGNFLDLQNSSSFTTSLGSMVDTFINIYKFDVPNVNNPLYNVLLWLFCVFPAELALMLFLKSVFGMAGVGAGILGNLIALVV